MTISAQSQISGVVSMGRGTQIRSCQDGLAELIDVIWSDGAEHGRRTPRSIGCLGAGMADSSLVHLLTRGVAIWNARRNRSLKVLDLTGIQIVNAVLAGIDLCNVDLDGTELRNVDLRGANLDRARLNGVTMDRVCLDGTSLVEAEIKGSDLDRCCLRRASLARAEAYELRIRRSIMRGANLSDAKLRGYTHLYNCDLTDLQCNGLRVEFGVLKRPCATDVTLERLVAAGFRPPELPNQPLSEDRPDCATFTVHVPDEEFGLVIAGGQSYWIAENRYDVFVSHVSKYKADVATPLAEELKKLDLRVWIDEWRIGLLDDLAEVITFGARASRLCVVILTPDFFGRRWTDEEFSLFRDRRVALVLHGVEPEQLSSLHPGLADVHLHLSWSLGSTEVASRIKQAVRELPRSMG